MEVCYWALLFMPLVILHHLLNVFVQLANKRGFTKKKKKIVWQPCNSLTIMNVTSHFRLEQCIVACRESEHFFHSCAAICMGI
jgi:hypothetical protein